MTKKLFLINNPEKEIEKFEIWLSVNSYPALVINLNSVKYVGGFF
jgi:hypothetical protein